MVLVMRNKATKKKIELESWKRRDTYLFYKSFSNPCWQISTNINVTHFYKDCKKNKKSLFLHSLFGVTKAANNIVNFRYRFYNGSPVEWDYVFPGSTILYDNDTFGFCYFDYYNREQIFVDEAEKKLKKQMLKRDFIPDVKCNNIIFFSIVPWISFTSIQHAKDNKGDDSIPKVVIGKVHKEGDNYLMPVSIEAHHAFVDGYHAGLLFESLEKVWGNA